MVTEGNTGQSGDEVPDVTESRSKQLSAEVNDRMTTKRSEPPSGNREIIYRSRKPAGHVPAVQRYSARFETKLKPSSKGCLVHRRPGQSILIRSRLFAYRSIRERRLRRVWSCSASRYGLDHNQKRMLKPTEFCIVKIRPFEIKLYAGF
jgi:hypothetical protein